MGFEGQKITQQAQKILAGLRAVQKEYDKVGENLDTLNRHISNSYNMMGQIDTGFSKLGEKIRITNVLEEEQKEYLSEKIS